MVCAARKIALMVSGSSALPSTSSSASSICWSSSRLSAMKVWSGSSKWSVMVGELRVSGLSRRLIENLSERQGIRTPRTALADMKARSVRRPPGTTEHQRPDAPASMSLTPDRSSSTSPHQPGTNQPSRRAIAGGVDGHLASNHERGCCQVLAIGPSWCFSPPAGSSGAGPASATAPSICCGWKGFTHPGLGACRPGPRASWPSPASVVSMITGAEAVGRKAA